MTFRPGRSAAAAALIGIALASTGCTRFTTRQGYVVDRTLVASVQPGVDNKESVRATLGRPSFVGQFDDNDWYYVSRVSKQLAFAEPKPTDNLVLHVRFDEAGNVASVEQTGLEEVASIDPSGDKTPTLGRDRGFFEELFGNIGAVNTPGMPGRTADNPQ
jgi:outer membrane protein assembly factor BamE (lipoprotein component of BamABCDE complex)